LVVCRFEAEDLGEEFYWVVAELLCSGGFGLVDEALTALEVEEWRHHFVEVHCSAFFGRVDHTYGPAL